MIFFAKKFVRPEDPDKANLEDVVDHIYHAASVAGWDHVGIGKIFLPCYNSILTSRKEAILTERAASLSGLKMFPHIRGSLKQS
jgi:microsomal dipeptidase-like Zn-dependent dipeptidase